ncbi:hypothetical protein MP228_005456 [Amoeboaphelidium protococcarum]|nr:hypothetical protein MP228_005456 [Amoeboaphelidium protococcarum]
MFITRPLFKIIHQSGKNKVGPRVINSNAVKSAKDAAKSILYETPLEVTPPTFKRHILSALVTNEPGVLSRVSGVLASRGFNIESLVACATEVPDLSRMTIVIRVETKPQQQQQVNICGHLSKLNKQEQIAGSSFQQMSAISRGDSVVEQARKQLEDQVACWGVLDYTDVSLIERELLLLKVEMNHETAIETQRQSLIELTKLFGGKVVDVHPTQMIIELSAKKRRIDAFIGIIKSADVGDVKEIVRSGLVVIPRTVIPNIDDQDDTADDENSSVESTMLPPG